MISFSTRLKTLLKNRGMTQAELAEKSNTTAATISRYLSDNRTPNIELLNNIAIALNVTADYLLGNTDDPTPAGKIKQSEKEKEGENMNKEDLNGKPVTQEQFNELAKNMANMATDINKIIGLLENLDIEPEDKKSV